MSTWHVSPLGNDANDGKSWQTCFATLGKAVASSDAGDTILLAPGTHHLESTPVVIGKVSIEGYDPEPAYTFDPPKKSYTLQPKTWLARGKLLSDLIAVMIVTPPYALLRHMHPIQGAAMAGEALLLAFSFRAILEFHRRRRARREREGR